MRLNQINPNVAIIGAVSGFGLYLLWKWTKADESETGSQSIHDRVADGIAQQLDEKAEQTLAVGSELPFSPLWWIDKIRDAYNAIN